MPRYIGTNDLILYMFGTTGGTITPSDGTLTPSNLQLLSDCIDRAESAIIDYTRREFAGTAGTVYYNRFTQGQMAGQALYLNQDVYSLVAVQNGDGQTIPLGSVWLEPRNVGPPYRILRLKSSYVWVWNTDADVTISGTFGYSVTPPDAVQQATVRYASWLYRQKDAGGVTGVEVSGFADSGEVQFPKGMPDDIRYLLSPYRSRSGGVI